MTAGCRVTQQGKHAYIIEIEAVRAHRIALAHMSGERPWVWTACDGVALLFLIDRGLLCNEEVGRGREGNENCESRKSCELGTL
jgi:hypothetical protein